MLSMPEKMIGLRQRVARLNSARFQQVKPLRDWQIIDHLPEAESPPAAAFNHPAHIMRGVSASELDTRPIVTCRQNGSAVVDSVKAAENGDGVIVRVYEAHGIRQEVSLSLDRDITQVEEVNILEEALSATHLTLAAPRHAPPASLPTTPVTDQTSHRA